MDASRRREAAGDPTAGSRDEGDGRGESPEVSPEEEVRRLVELVAGERRPDEMLEAVLEAALELLEADLAASWRPDLRVGEVRLERGMGWKREELRLPLESPAGRAALAEAPSGSELRDPDVGQAAHGARSALAVRVEGRGRRDAGLAVYSRSERRFSQRERRLLSALAALLAMARSRQREERLAREAAEARLQAAVAALVAGVSHDFNNILSVVLSYSRLIADDPGASTAIREGAEEIAAAAARGTQVARNLVDLMRSGSGEVAAVDVGAALHGVARLLQVALGEQVRMSIDVDPAVPPVNLRAGDLERIVVNLALNARDAVDGAGEILVTAHPEGDWGERRAVIAVADDGTGMEPEVAAHAVDRGFTTKPLTQGSGLGLHSVHEIVTDAGGELAISTELGVGSTVTIRLPASAERGEAG